MYTLCVFVLSDWFDQSGKYYRRGQLKLQFMNNNKSVLLLLLFYDKIVEVRIYALLSVALTLDTWNRASGVRWPPSNVRYRPRPLTSNVSGLLLPEP